MAQVEYRIFQLVFNVGPPLTIDLIGHHVVDGRALSGNEAHTYYLHPEDVPPPTVDEKTGEIIEEPALCFDFEPGHRRRFEEMLEEMIEQCLTRKGLPT